LPYSIARNTVVDMKPIYSASAVATGDGRNGHVESTDGILAADVRMPPEMGGPGGATNPEQLFAAGYAACFHSALRIVAQKAGADVSGSEVVADVSIGDDGEGSFGLAVELEVTLPNVSREDAEKLVHAAHQVCPYSNATRGNIEVALTVA
jgi:osmotically inducible protein OsmC